MSGLFGATSYLASDEIMAEVEVGERLVRLHVLHEIRRLWRRIEVGVKECTWILLGSGCDSCRNQEKGYTYG